MRATALALGAWLVASAGCAHHAVLITDDGQSFSATRPDAVRFYATRSPGFPYVIIGPAAVMVLGDGPEALRELAMTAAGFGADAVLDVRLNKLSRNTGATGLLVRRQDSTQRTHAPPPPPQPSAPPPPPPTPVPAPSVAPPPTPAPTSPAPPAGSPATAPPG